MTSAFNKIRVLAVDDNRTNLHILQVFLKKLGHDVILAENGEIAVQRFEQERPDLILLDIMMPVMDGFEAARRIKAGSQGKWVPIIFLSALNRDENLVEGLEAGADDYLTKPINFVVLEAKLRSMQRSLALQQSATIAFERLQAISDNVLDAIVTSDSNGSILTVNHATSRIFGRTAEEMTGQHISILLPGASKDKVSGRFLEQLAKHTSAQGMEREAFAQHGNGRKFPVEIGVSEVKIDAEKLFVSVIRDISERKAAELKLQENAKQLQIYFDHNQTEQQLALRLMEKQLHRPGLDDPRIRYRVMATENFSGDIVAASRSPEGRFYALLADATGHGLPAAISVLPVLALFYRMTRLNRSITELVIEMNQQLRESIPVGRFVAATIVCLDELSLIGEIWVGGTPEALIIDRWGHPARHFRSDNLALGILDSRDIECRPETFEWAKESQLLMYSDGLLEAENAQGKQFGPEGVLAAIANTSPENRFPALEKALATHLGSNSAADDVSLMIIDCP
ncbi:SpoIIE family protein phosphatase [Azonexus sp.]|uniref:SpoIIE family protein phosphatase n=1 Tax=Azonexus sp. TaxID=1872668 RepID=UPI0027B930A3|nr:SpoIIE family protein phosphatase [Azonexus sp.]